MTVMIHEVTPEILELDLSDFVCITFDDGLYSQYLHYNHFMKFNKPMYFFISTGIVCEAVRQQNPEVISCSDAHDEFFKTGSKRNYMNWEQIHELKDAGCIIGGHTHTHPRLKDKPIREIAPLVGDEVNKMMDEFETQGIEINSFCYPYNEEVFGYMTFLKKRGVTEFFSHSRVPVESLLV